MSISKVRTEEVAPSGKPLFLVRTPHSVTRRLLGVPFRDGIGRTIHPDKAQAFDEVFHYEVTLPPGFRPKWKKDPKVEAAGEFAAEEDIVSSDDVDDEADDEGAEVD